MRYGFTFKDIHSSEYGVTVRTKSRPIIPERKSFTVSLPYRDGEYDFSEANADGREHYSNRVFRLSLTVTADDLGALQAKIGKLSKWLCGSGDMIFDDIPLVVWRGKITDEIIFMPEHSGHSATMEISFSAEPFGKNIFGTEGPRLGDPIPLDSDIPLSMDELYTCTINGSGKTNFTNFGDRPARPVFLLEGTDGTVTMSVGDKSLSFTASGSVTVDFKKQLVTDRNGALRISGDFYEFPVGRSALHITHSGSSALNVTAIFEPEFMYTADYEDIDWGEDNA